MFGFGSGKSRLADVPQPSLEELHKRTRIVVIDDTPEHFPIDILRNEGYAIDSWKRVEDLGKLESGAFDIIFLDIANVAEHLDPVSDGIGVLRHLKKYNPGQIVVAFSGRPFSIGQTEFFRLADDTMSKPISALDAKERIDNLLMSKVTVTHYWGAIAALLQRADVPTKKIAALEKAVLKAARKDTDFEQLKASVRGLVTDAQLAVSLGTLIVKIASLCSAGLGHA